jgi:hypothetical protein
MEKAGRAYALKEFDVRLIVEKTLALYNAK